MALAEVAWAGEKQFFGSTPPVALGVRRGITGVADVVRTATARPEPRPTDAFVHPMVKCDSGEFDNAWMAHAGVVQSTSSINIHLLTQNNLGRARLRRAAAVR